MGPALLVQVGLMLLLGVHLLEEAVMSKPSRVRGSEPVARVHVRLRDFLERAGVHEQNSRGASGRLAHLSRWLALKRLGPDAVTAARRRSGVKQCWSARSFSVTLAYLGSCRLWTSASSEPAAALDDLLADYRRYLVTGLGLAASRVDTWTPRCGSRRSAALGTVGGSDIVGHGGVAPCAWCGRVRSRSR
jgi:hypothetical protein